MITLNGVELPLALWWSDEFEYNAVAQTATKTPSGHLVIQRGRMKEGRPITLVGAENTTWLTRSEVIAISSLLNLDDPLTLNLRGTEYKVKVALHESDYFVALPKKKCLKTLDDDGMYYLSSLKLIEVLE